MPHPKEVKRRHGKLWHLEDKELTLVEARSLKKHLRKTEDKSARVIKGAKGYEVWWAK